MKPFRFVLGLLVLALAPAAWAADEPAFTRTEDVIYGRKFGTALTMDVFAPKKDANGAAVLWMVSGGWYSDHAWVSPEFVREFVKRGYTVFAVVHGSQPKYTIPEAVDDVKRAARYIRYHAKDYHVAPNRFGVMGASAGGHLSLMLGTTSDDGNPQARDPIDRVSSKVQAVACFFPPTDFFNYGEKGKEALGRGTLKDFRAPFDFQKFDAKAKKFVPVSDEEAREIGRKVSPVYHVTAKSAPSLLIHGDADRLVPIQQAELIVEKFEEAGVPHKLVVKKGKEHGWPDLPRDLPILADWFDQYLLKNKADSAGN